MDKLDKTLDELQKGKKKKNVEIPISVGAVQLWKEVNNIEENVDIVKICPRCGEPLTKEHNCYEWVGDSKVEQKLQENVKQLGLKDVYLPFVLTRLQICGINAEARKLIMSGKVKINNNVVGLGFNTKELSNFLLEVDGVKYEIFKID